MKWKLHFTSNHSLPARPRWQDYNSEVAALSAACDMMKASHTTVLYVEGPDHKRIEPEAIKRWCDASQRPDES
ncbi:MAG TPA: hypothetical protein VNX23_04800 [Bradyrhizobium sp.]|jgi:hypothetical protein|uniref:hypothetical protein n=1 Tax=Bradyrhizobium sp. TaxID=376 RepID=UPI002D1711FA|nr:hypothetical protein [Bradyrhizobium sp.]HXB76724.1 hypothetical protein [Bradyrhizobium sp.]